MEFESGSNFILMKFKKFKLWIRRFFGEMECGYCHEVGVIFVVVKELGKFRMC